MQPTHRYVTRCTIMQVTLTRCTLIAARVVLQHSNVQRLALPLC
jgi:hypothetical protein